jgi:hypothetical protein
MDSKRIFLLERDGIEAAAASALIRQAGHLVAGPVHSLEEAVRRAESASCDMALLERDLGDGTDATPVAEAFSAAGIAYAFIISPGDPTDAAAFPGIAFLRKPLNAASVRAVIDGLLGVGELAEANGLTPRNAARSDEIGLISKRSRRPL